MKTETSGWLSYVPLGAAVLAAVIAITATRTAVFFSSRRTERSCARTLLAEISAITASLDAAKTKQSEADPVRIEYLRDPGSLCSMYKGIGANFGLLRKEVALATVLFYSEVLTTVPVSENYYSREQLSRISVLGHDAKDSIRKKYQEAN